MKPRDRQAAADLWLRVVKGGVNWDAALETTPSFLRLDGRDRGFAYRLAAAALRHHNVITDIARTLTGRDFIKPVEAAALIHLGLCEVLFLDTPAHAAVHSTVELADKKYKGFVNAVLRRALREKDDILAGIDLPKQAAPSWLWTQLVKDWGEDEARALIAFCLREPVTDITLKHPDQSGLWQEWLSAEPHKFGGLRLVAGGTITAQPGYAEGDWWVQDAAASLPAQMAGSDLKALKAIDLCAAPGGKTLQLAAAGAEVTAVDIDAERLRRVAENAARVGLADRITLIHKNALELEGTEVYDVVLLDAPCSATGTLRRHPDMWGQSKSRDISEFVRIQKDLLDHAATLVKPGGVLIYATCSLDPREGEAQRDLFLEAHKNYNIYINTNIDAYGRIFPHQSQSDGFFFCAFKRHLGIV